MVPLLVGALAAGCGTGAERPTAPDEPVAARGAVPAAGPDASFPAASGRPLHRVLDGLPVGPRLVPSVTVLHRGSNRIAFALADSARRHVSASSVALYVAREDGGGARGPFRATRLLLSADPRFRSAGATRDLQRGDAFYTARVPFGRAGPRVLTALARLDGRLVATTRAVLQVDARPRPPEVGEQAVAVHTQTREDVRGDLAQLSTRRPPLPAMHEHDLAEVLGRRPVVLLFASPRLCRTRTSGPVLDLAEQVRRRWGDGVAFIHQEIWVGNDRTRGLRPQVVAWRLRHEPWAFVMDRSGKIVARFEGAFSAAELREAVQLAKRAPGR